MAKILSEIESIARSYVRLLNQERRIDKAYLYGSYAKGSNNTWSDIDLALVSPDFSEDLFQERIHLMKLALQVDDRIEPTPFRPDDFDEVNPLVTEICRYGIDIV